MRRLFALPLFALALALAGCGGGNGGGGETTGTLTAGVETTGSQSQILSADCDAMPPPTRKTRKEPKPTKGLDPEKTYEVTMKTNCGSFTFRLNLRQSPNAAASFVSLVRAGYFDHTIFHRIVPAFVIQGGDPAATYPSPAAAGGPGYTTVDKPPATARYVHGTVAMAKAAAEAPGTAGSQFFIVTGAYAQLPPDYAIVGKVVQGIDIVDRIGKLGHANESPTQVVEIEKATVSTPTA